MFENSVKLSPKMRAAIMSVPTVHESILSQSCPLHRMEEPTDILLIIVGAFILVVALSALVALVISDEAATTPKPTELPMSAQTT